VIEQYGSWSITNKSWSKDSWILEKVLARVAVNLEIDAFLSFDVQNDPFNRSKPVLVTVSEVQIIENTVIETDVFNFYQY
jgi:hypothetical protein